MHWNSWQDFFAMGGYALYVWGSYAVTFIVLAAEIISLRARKKALGNGTLPDQRSNLRAANEA